ncbi:MAG: hypothetical protein WB691_13575 [Pseudolabrys sp.]
MLFAQCRYDEGIGNDRSSEGNGTLNGILNIIDATYGVQCDGIP